MSVRPHDTSSVTDFNMMKIFEKNLSSLSKHLSNEPLREIFTM